MLFAVLPAFAPRASGFDAGAAIHHVMGSPTTPSIVPPPKVPLIGLK